MGACWDKSRCVSLPGSLRTPPAPSSPPDTHSGSDRWPAGCWWNSGGGVGKVAVKSGSTRCSMWCQIRVSSRPEFGIKAVPGNGPISKSKVGTAGFLLARLVFFPRSAEAPKSFFFVFFLFGEVKSTPSTRGFSRAHPDFHKQLSLQLSLQKNKRRSKTRVIYGRGLEAGKHVGILKSLIYSEDGQF